MSTAALQIHSALEKLVQDEDIQLSFPDTLAHGDYTTNLALIHAHKEKVSPHELASKWVSRLKENTDLTEIAEVSVAGPGFINFTLTNRFLSKELRKILKDKDRYGLNQSWGGKKVIVEYTDPNPFKEFHIGHLYPNIVGETLARLFESNGAQVYRASYQGDVGLHVAKALFGARTLMNDQTMSMEDLQSKGIDFQIKFFAESYSYGSQRYEESEEVKSEVKLLNQQIYQKVVEVYSLYHLGREASLAYFETMYKRLGTEFDYYYFESEVADEALAIVKKFLAKGIFEESKGAVIFPGEKYGVHTRVFINNQGLPTYEAKDLALAQKKSTDVSYDLSVIVTANEVDEYFKVVLKALSLIDPDLAKKTKHISHGLVKLPEGKISSRTGNVVLAEWLLDKATETAATLSTSMKENNDKCEQVGLAAVRFALLKNTLGGDVEFNFSSSVSFTGNSGPYLQYTYARALSVIEKSTLPKEPYTDERVEMNREELEIMRFLSRFPEIIANAQKKYSPNMLCSYLYELAQKYNTFYNLHHIIGTDQEAFRVALTTATAAVLKQGLSILGIQSPEKL